MKKIKIIIPILVVLLIVVCIALAIITNNQKKQEEKYGKVDPPVDVSESIAAYTNKMVRIKEDSSFYTLESYVKRLLANLEYKDSDGIISLLTEDYKEKNAITSKNVQDKIKFDGQDSSYNALEIYESANTGRYIIKGEIGKEKVYFKIVEDSKNSTFAIEPITEEYYNNSVENQMEEEDSVTIAKNDYNSIRKIRITQEDIVQKYFNSYIQNVINYPQEVYNMLDEEYKNKKFGSFDNFKKYINNKADLLNLLNIYNRKSYSDFATSQEYEEYYLQFLDVGLTQYIVNTYTDYTEYICYDQEDNVYIFREKAPNDYTIILDAYTIEIPSVKQKYETSTDQDKVAMNIEKIKQAVNDKDYTYVYNKLDETFKNNNYPTEASFEQKMQSELYGRNDFSYTKVESKSNVYVCDVTVTDASVKNSTAQKILHVFMQLKDETDFVLSFNIE